MVGPGEEAAADRGDEEEDTAVGKGVREEDAGVGLGLSLVRVSANLFLLASAASLLTTVVGDTEKRGLLVAARCTALSSLETGGTPEHRKQNKKQEQEQEQEKMQKQKQKHKQDNEHI